MTAPATPTTADAATEPATFRVRDFVDAAQLKRDLAFSDNNLTEAMMDQASLFAYYGTLAADAAHQTDVVEMLLESTEAAVYKMLRDQAAVKAEKVTEEQLKKLVARHSKVIGMKKALNQSKRVESICKTATEAFRHRRDMLVQQGLISREEMKGEVVIAQRNVREDALAEQRRSVLDRIKKDKE